MDKLKIHGIKCKKCGTIVYSRAGHDWRQCDCASVYIDGGFDLIRIGGNPEDIESIEIELEGVTKKELYNDWNKRIDKYGRIRTALSSSGNSKS